MQFSADILSRTPPEQVSSIGTEPALADLLAEARMLAEEQRALTQALQAARDPKHWYVQLCHLITQETLALSESNQLTNPDWALRLLSILHSRFLYNLRRWMSPTLGSLDPHWESAFCAFNLAGEATTVYSVLTGLHLALRARLEYDLPQAVAQALRGGLPSDCARCRAGLPEASPGLHRAVGRLLAQTAAPHLPKWLARTGQRLLGESLELLLRRYVYDVGAQRNRALERGIQLAEKQLQRNPALEQPTQRCMSVQPVQVPARTYRSLSVLPAAAPASCSGRVAPRPAAIDVTARKRAVCETFPGSEADAA